MDKNNAIEVRNLTKRFKVYYDKGNSFKERLLFRERNAHENRWVINDISFDVKKGEAIGLVGHNGCGKSTTLKLLSKIIYPDSGTIEMAGRVSSLIELGAGFHKDMTGRENIYTNAAIFGLTRKEIDSRIEDIIAFSELDEFIDNPVRTYSSGMYMRLAFSVAINVDADILLIDEILAVGDAGFQTKCFNKLKEIKSNGTTIVIVSHSLGQIEQICERSIWIHEGKIEAEGKPRDVHPQYLDYMAQQRSIIAEKEAKRKKEKEAREHPETAGGEESPDEPDENKPDENESHDTEEKKNKTRWGNGDCKVTEVRMLDSRNVTNTSFNTGEAITIEVDYTVTKKVNDGVFGIGIFRSDGVHVYGTNTRIDNLEIFDIETDGTFKITLEHLELLPGNYVLDVSIEYEQGIPVDFYKNALKFDVFSKLGDIGVSRLAHRWDI